MTDAPTGISYVDSHAHLDDEEFKHDIDDVINRAANAGVTRIVNIGYEPVRWQTTIELARRFPCISFTLGLHPSESDQFQQDLIDELASIAESSGAVAIGEIGLDLFRNGTSLDLQIQSFEAQLAVARSLELPVVIHQRGASAELHRVLREASPTTRCVLHSFDGNEDLVSLGLERGYLFGIGGLMTRASSEDLRRLIREIPLEFMVLETDSPYLTPAGLKTRRNEPVNLPVIAEALANLLDLPMTDVADTTTRKAIGFFRLDAQGQIEDTIQ